MMDKNLIRKESVKKASRVFLTGNQYTKNKILDHLFSEQSSLLTFLKYMDRAINNEPLKEVVLQLMAIIYYSMSLQKIKVKKISDNEWVDTLASGAEMKNYFHNSGHKFDEESFKSVIEKYAQKEILNYTYFAINNQFRDYIDDENDALFVFYMLKIFGEVMNKNILNEPIQKK